MQIVLLQDIKSLGKKGEIKNVSDGYALNFILPKKLAVIATPEAIAQVEAEKSHKDKLEQQTLMANKALAEKLKNLKIELKVKEKEGKLFGSIHAKDVVSELKNLNFDIPEKCIKIEQVIKKIGDYTVKIELQNNVSTTIVLKVSGTK